MMHSWSFLGQYDLEYEECEAKGRQIQTEIRDECEKYIQMLNNYKNLYIESIDKHRQTNKPLSVD